MEREKKYAVALIGTGVLTLPIFVGIALLATGIVLLAAGDRIHAARWIRVLFWIMLAGFALSLALLFLVPDKGHSAEAGMARAYFCAIPAFLAIMVSVALAALTVVRYKSLRWRHRIMGLGLAGLGLLGLGVALVLDYPEPTLCIAGLIGAGALGVWYWQRRRARPAGTPPSLPVPPPDLIASLPPVVRPPRRRPVCNLLALLLPVLAVPMGILIGYAFDKFTNPQGFEAWGILGLMVLPLILAVPASLILAIVSLWRRERFPALAIGELILCGLMLLGVALSLL